MSEHKLDVVVKAIKLMEYTMTITSNRKRYPMKYIQLIKRIQDECMKIYELLMYANSVDINKQKEERLEAQKDVVLSCDRLSCYVELSMNLNIIGANTVEHWQKQISNVKYMTIGWREKDKRR